MQSEFISQLGATYDELLDAVEVQMSQQPQMDVPTEHEFTPGLYTRSIRVPGNTYLLSLVHNTEHQFILSKGQIIIYDQSGMKVLNGTWIGKTMPGTRRLAKTITECIWTSIHATSIYPSDNSEEAKQAAIRLVEEELYAKHENIYLIKLPEELAA